MNRVFIESLSFALICALSAATFSGCKSTPKASGYVTGPEPARAAFNGNLHQMAEAEGVDVSHLRIEIEINPQRATEGNVLARTIIYTGKKITVFIRDPNEDHRILRHEAGHIIRWLKKGDADAGHNDRGFAVKHNIWMWR